jgi:glucans biosynthesis protein
MTINRRDFVGTVGSCAVLALASPSAILAAPRGFDPQTITELAKSLAAKPFTPPQPVGEPFASLGYDQYRDIRYRPELTYWLGEERGFTLQFMHAGFIYKTPVRINIIEDGEAREIQYGSHLFNFGPKLQVPPIYDQPLFSGFRLKAPLDSERQDEFLVFQGASYFRALGSGQLYGTSARGIAIDTAEPKGEEFPFFRSFWIERPPVRSKTITIYALLDSLSLTGAFTFQVTPGTSTLLDVEARLFARRDIGHLGIAPLTSMFFFAQRGRRFDDYRTAVHDTDCLAIAQKGGDWIVRPLANPQTLQVSSFGDEPIRGFGLQQRSRSFWHYDDLEARYELRPSTWIEPKDDWGSGQIELVEIPTGYEFNDNIVAFWRPAAPFAAGESRSYTYWLSFGQPVIERSLARIAGTRSGAGPGGKHLFVVDFDPPFGKDAPTDWGDASLQASASAGTLKNIRGETNTFTGGYRATFELYPEGAQLSELKLILLKSGKPASEIWLYRWTD